MGSGPIAWAGDIVAGSWDALTNITKGIGKGAEALISPFFPSPQKTSPTKSETVAAAGGTGMTYRPVNLENQSMVETANYAAAGWVGSPYAENFAIPTKKQESVELAQLVTSGQQKAGPVETIVDVFEYGLKQATKIKTVFDEFADLWNLKKREPISEGPKEVGNSPGVIQNVQQEINRGVDTIKAWGTKIVEQAKGLFNLAFGGTEKGQPAFEIKHDIDLSTKTTIYIAVAVAVIVAVLLLRKK